MSNTIWQRIVLLLAGLVAVAVGMAVLFWPQEFYASSGVVLVDSPTLLSEIRAPAMVLIVLGIVLLSAIVMAQLRQSALLMASVLYLSYGGGRLVSLALDGMPHSNILFAMAIEMGIGLSCAYVFWGNFNGSGARAMA